MTDTLSIPKTKRLTARRTPTGSRLAMKGCILATSLKRCNVAAVIAISLPTDASLEILVRDVQRELPSGRAGAHSLAAATRPRMPPGR